MNRMRLFSFAGLLFFFLAVSFCEEGTTAVSFPRFGIRGYAECLSGNQYLPFGGGVGGFLVFTDWLRAGVDIDGSVGAGWPSTELMTSLWCAAYAYTGPISWGIEPFVSLGTDGIPLNPKGMQWGFEAGGGVLAHVGVDVGDHAIVFGAGGIRACRYHLGSKYPFDFSPLLFRAGMEWVF